MSKNVKKSESNMSFKEYNISKFGGMSNDDQSILK